MKKIIVQLKVMLILGLTAGSSHAGGMPYGGMPYGGSPYGGAPGTPYGGHPGMNPYNKDQRKAYKQQIKRQQMQMFFSQNPRATQDQWKYYWKQYKMQHGLH